MLSSHVVKWCFLFAAEIVKGRKVHLFRRVGVVVVGRSKLFRSLKSRVLRWVDLLFCLN